MAKTAPRRQAQHHAPDEPKAQLLVLRMQGHSMASASELVGVSERTGWNWWSRCREVARNKETPEIMDAWVRIVRRAQDHMHTYLDYLDEHPEDIPKHAATLNIYAGTGSDKLQKKSEPEVHDAKNVIIILNARDPDIIEGEAADEAIEGEVVEPKALPEPEDSQ